MADPTAFIQATMQTVLRKLKAGGVSMRAVGEYSAEVIGDTVVIDCGGVFAEARRGRLTKDQESVCAFIAVSREYVRVHGSGTNEERALSAWWHRFEGRLSKGEIEQSVRGAGKRGHEGPVKQYIRDVIADGADDYDAMLVALEDHVKVHDIGGDKLTYEDGKGKIRDITLKAVRKAYREIMK